MALREEVALSPIVHQADSSGFTIGINRVEFGSLGVEGTIDAALELLKKRTAQAACQGGASETSCGAGGGCIWRAEKDIGEFLCSFE